MQYSVQLQEIWHQTYEVEADTPEQALQRDLDLAPGDAMEQSLEYVTFYDDGFVTVIDDEQRDVVLSGYASDLLPMEDEDSNGE